MQSRLTSWFAPCKLQADMLSQLKLACKEAQSCSPLS